MEQLHQPKQESGLIVKTNAYLCRSAALVLQQFLSNLSQIFFGEDEANVADDIRQQVLELRILLEMITDCLADHGVLAHYDFAVT